MKPATDGGAVTVNNPHPGLTTGADGAAGKITTLTVLLSQPLPPEVPGAIEPHEEIKVYLASIEWQPGVVIEAGVEVKLPPSILYSIVNPEMEGTEGSVNAEAQVLIGTVNTGAAGKTTALTVASGQITLMEFARVLPQSAVSLYLALIVQQPAVLLSKALAVVRSP